MLIRACSSSSVRSVREYELPSVRIDHALTPKPAASTTRPTGATVGGSGRPGSHRANRGRSAASP